jgi:N4-gp56 family major capsid protein
MPKKKGDNITYRRWLPFGATTTDVNTQNRPSVTAADHIVQEGVTPEADSLTPVDVNIVQQQYACIYVYTDKAAELYEDDIPEEMKIQTGERMGLLREMIRYGAMKAASNVLYAGGTSRTTVDQRISLNLIDQMTLTLKRNHAKMKSRVLSAGPNYDTSAIKPSYFVFVSTDCESDIYDLEDFTPVEKYSRFQPVNEHEIGACRNFRFFTSPELTAYADSGAAIGSTGLYSTTGTSIDVYPFIVMGEDAVYDVALRGLNSFDVNHIPHNKIEKSDPGGQRGYVSAFFWDAVSIVNGGWMGVIEAGRTKLV